MDDDVTPVTTTVDGLEVRRWPPPTGVSAPASLVLLHEGLGSVELWRGFPAALARATGCEVVAWSRAGHGRSRALSRPHRPDYMHQEAMRVGAVLEALDVATPVVLVGHSDGASIALLHAAAAGRRIAALALLAPHVVVEQQSVEGIAAAREEYLTTDLPTRMARYHDDADALFWAWNDVWLSDEFRSWDITGVLGDVDQPVLLVQCADDRYGTLRQLDLVAQGVVGDSRRLVPAEGGHSPHLAHPEAVVAAVAELVAEHVR